MKKHLIAAALAAAGLSTSAAHALGPTATPAYIIYAGSGSAQPNAVYWAATQLLNNVDSYTDDTGCAQSGTYRILFGQAKAQIGTSGTVIPAGANVLFEYRFAGGTFLNAIQSVALASSSGMVYPTVAAVTGASKGSCGSTLPAPTYILAPSLTGSNIPDFGVADEETALFNTKTNVPGTYTVHSSGKQTFVPGTPLTTAQLSSMTSTGLYNNLIGIAVTNQVYTGGAHPKTSFSKAEIAGILTGGIQDWSQLYGDDGQPMTAGPIVLLDRAPGSGTKAGINSYFLQNPGTNAAGGNLIAYNSTTSTIGGGPTTTATTLGSGATCSAFADVNEKSSTTLYQDLQFLNTNGCRAIGILGLEFPPETSGGGYQFVKINGVDPYSRVTSSPHVYATYANEINGSYDLFYTNSFNVRTVSLNGGSYQGDGSAVQNFVAAMQKQLASNSLPGGVSGQFPAGVPGVLLDPTVEGVVAPCETLDSRSLVSVSVLAPVLDASIIGGTVPACNDPLQ